MKRKHVILLFVICLVIVEVSPIALSIPGYIRSIYGSSGGGSRNACGTLNHPNPCNSAVPESTTSGSPTPGPTPPGMATVKIDPDKVLNVNGKRTFPVGIYSVCNRYWESAGLAGPCNPSLNKEFLFSADLEPNKAELNQYKSLYENAGIYYTLFAPEVVNNIPQNLIDSPNFLAYYQQDEPTDVATISNTYNSIKAQDPNHPVILNVFQDMTKWYPYSDVITWDLYTFTDTRRYPPEDSIYFYEQIADYAFFKGTDINSINKPVWAVLQANGIYYPFSILQGSGYRVPAPAEVRSVTYAAITMDVKGIVYWGYESGTNSPFISVGLDRNPILHTYYRQLASELKSFNDWLVSPTVDYSWKYHPGNNRVVFNKLLSKTVIGVQFTNFNYILKNYNGTYYLIVVNKDSRPVSDVTITIAGLTGSATATTIGLETQGSGRAGRTISVNNGIFTDSFDGSSVHIYDIGT